MSKHIPDEIVVRTVKDYLKSGDMAKTVATRNGVHSSQLVGWLRKLDIKYEKRMRNWTAIKTLVQG